MGQKIQRSSPPLIELENFPDVMVTSIARIERLPGDLLRFVFAVERQIGSDRVRVPVASHIWPLSQIPAAMRQTAEAVAREPLEIDENGEARTAH